jgi:hypothetical protein
MKKEGDRFDDDKIIDITDYVNNKQSNEELEMDNFTSNFVSMINQNLIDRQKKAAKERFIYFMINFLLLSQFISAIAIAVILNKLYP